jgi:hypothetical protein
MARVAVGKDLRDGFGFPSSRPVHGFRFGVGGGAIGLAPPPESKWKTNGDQKSVTAKVANKFTVELATNQMMASY